MDLVRMFINGQALTGGSLHSALDGATLIGEVLTAAGYRFFAVRDEFPGLHPVPTGGVEVPGELYELPYRMLRESLLPREPAELELGVIKLADGSGSLAMRMRGEALGRPDVTDISDRGGWKAYLAEVTAGRPRARSVLESAIRHERHMPGDPKTRPARRWGRQPPPC